jgi:mannose/fructose/N-acetylgalactosamine-specific phosphotransferase system component IIC
MPIVLCRVDDRLVHGQVVVGWGRPLDLQRIVLVDDEVRASPWEQELYRMAAPPGMTVEFASAAEAAPQLAAWEAGKERVLVLVGTIALASDLERRAPGRHPRRPGTAGAAPVPLSLGRRAGHAARTGPTGHPDQRPGPADLARGSALGSRMTEFPIVALLIWGTVVGLDLASMLQGLFSRPLVAGAVAGVILNDPMTGLRIGVTLELFALDVLPVGASRYPDYGAATVAAVAAGAGESWTAALGPAVLLGLLLAHLGGWTIVLHRRVTAWALARAEHKLDRGEPGIASRVHLVGLTSDLLRSAALTALGLAAAALLDYAPRLDVGTERALAIVVVAGGFVAVIGGALRRAGTLRRMVWLAGGMALGVLGLGLS